MKKRSVKPEVARVKAKITFIDDGVTTRYSFDRHWSHFHKAKITDEWLGFEKLKEMIADYGHRIKEVVFYISLDPRPLTAQYHYNTCVGAFTLEAGYRMDHRWSFSENKLNLFKFMS